ncbi:MAG: DUF2442 domain-containing protein [Gammaproteobacteria bacterium]
MDRERFARARERGRARSQDRSAVVAAQYDTERDTISLRFRSGGAMAIPREIIPDLSHVPTDTLETVAVSPAGDALSWPSLNVDVYIPGLVERAFVRARRPRKRVYAPRRPR